MDIFDILLDILLKPPQPFIGLFLLVFIDFRHGILCKCSQNAIYLAVIKVVTFLGKKM